MLDIKTEHAPLTEHLALGCHVFAGGFTMGVREIMHVPGQLEVHGLGHLTATQGMGLKWWQVSDTGSDFKDSIDRVVDAWPAPPDGTRFLFGNPRCTGFSCITGGYGEDVHGAWAKQTVDLHQLMGYGVKHGIDAICWESVQQAYTTGRPMLRQVIETMFRPMGYRVAHLFINASTFGNVQERKRYFFLAYRDDKNFNIRPPEVCERHTTVGDVLLTDEWKQYTPRMAKTHSKGWEGRADDHMWINRDEEPLVPVLPWDHDVNAFARHYPEQMQALSPRYWEMWDMRTSDLPFSMHSIMRLNPHRHCSVLSGSCGRYIHPLEDRKITVREAARLMGWPAEITPRGYAPFGQIGKGICPAVGRWLAEQVALYLDDAWGSEDWESTYDDVRGKWVGQSFQGDAVRPPEKVFDLTDYCPPKLERSHREDTVRSFHEHRESMAGRR